MNHLTLDEILRLHFQIITDFGGLHGVRDENRLHSVVKASQQSAFGEDQYPLLCEKAAVYLRNIVGDHPFIEGNKRTAVTVCGVFLMRNGKKLTASPEELEDFTVRVATDHLDIVAIAAWLHNHSWT